MSESGTSLENLKDAFANEAKQAAMTKMEDIVINQNRFLKHGFARFGPLSTKSDQFAPLQKTLRPDMDRVPTVLRYGLTSQKFADKVGVGLSRNWSDPNNEEGVSLVRAEIAIENTFWIAAFAALKTDPNLKVSSENLFVVLIDNNIYRSMKDGFESLRKYRVSPKYFKGLVILDRKLSERTWREAEKFPSLPLPNINYSSKAPEEIAGNIYRIMLQVNKDSPKRCIPIYGLTGRMYWPKEMSYYDIQMELFERLMTRGRKK